MGKGIPDHWFNLRKAAAGYIMEFGREKTKEIWNKHGGTGKPGFVNGFPSSKTQCEQLYGAMFDEIIERREKRISLYRHMKKSNAAIECLKELIKAMKLSPCRAITDDSEIAALIEKLKIDAKTANRLVLELKPDA